MQGLLNSCHLRCKSKTPTSLERALLTLFSWNSSYSSPSICFFFFFPELFTVSSDGRRSARGYQLTARAAVGTPLLYVAHITKNDYWINNKTSISNWIGGSNYSQLHAIYFKTLKDINLSRTPYALRLCLIKTIFLFYGRWQLLWEPILIIRMKCN